MMNLIIQLVSGAVGGIGAGKVMPKFSLGNIGNIIAGVVGGGLGGQILSMVGMNMGGGAGLDVVSIIGDIASGGVGGGALLAIIGVIRKAISR